MKKTKDILIFAFALIVISALAYIIFLFFYVQKRYAESPIDNKSIFTESRFLSGFSNDALKLRTEYLLIKTVRDSIVTYDYKSEMDSSRNLKVSYLTKNKKLQFNLTDYEKYEEKAFEINGIWFDKYEMTEPIVDGISPIIFNEEYGILAITGPLNPPLFFMEKSNDTVYAERIMNVLWK